MRVEFLATTGAADGGTRPRGTVANDVTVGTTHRAVAVESGTFDRSLSSAVTGPRSGRSSPDREELVRALAGRDTAITPGEAVAMPDAVGVAS